MHKIIGTMSGTSCDGIDVALIETDGRDKIAMLGGMTHSYTDDFVQVLKSLRRDSPHDEVLEVEKQLTILHAHAVNQFISEHNLQNVDAIGFHGHTVYHDPENGITDQIGNAHLLAALTKIPVVHDFRRMDVASGGCGAPLVPIFHQAMNKMLGLNKSIYLNIGGVSNITYVAQDTLIAFDTGPGNALIDDFLFPRTGLEFDTDGFIATRGVVNMDIVQAFLSDQFTTRTWPKSLDRNYFHHIDVAHLSVFNGVATLAYATAALIAHAVSSFDVDQVIISGGGRKNQFILDTLTKLLNCNVQKIDDYGVDGDLVEAYAFGYLTSRSLQKLPISFPTTTNAHTAVCGGSHSYI